MTLEKERRSVGVFAKCSDVEFALQKLKAAGFPMHKVSVIARNAKEKDGIAGVEIKEHTGNTSEVGAVAGTALGGLTSLLLGVCILAIPGIGQVMLAGAEATAIATTLAGGLPGMLLSLGIPEKEAQGYSDIVCKGYYLVIVRGIDIEIRIAKRIFNRCDIQQWGVYDPYSTPASRYKRAVGIFYRHQEAEKALIELRSAGFPMSQVSIVVKHSSSLRDISSINISVFQDKFTTLGISDDLARYYEHQVNLGHYLVVIKGTDIYIAGARAIFESNKIQHFSIYGQSELDAAKSDRQVTSTNFYL